MLAVPAPKTPVRVVEPPAEITVGRAVKLVSDGGATTWTVVLMVWSCVVAALVTWRW